MHMRNLKDIEIDEISLQGLVDVPAIRKKFVIVKSKDNGEQFDKNQDGFHNENEKEVKTMLDKLVKIFKEINGLEEISEGQMEVLKALSEEDMKKYSEALEVLKKYKDELPEDLNKELSELAKFGVREVEKTEGEKKDEEDVEKAGKKLSKDTLKVIEGAVKKLADLTEIVNSLSNLLPKEDTEKMAAEKAEKEKLENKIDKAVKESKEETDKELTKKDEVIEELKKRVGTLEETKNGKKSLEEESSDDDDTNKHIKKDGEFEWTFYKQGKEE